MGQPAGEFERFLAPLSQPLRDAVVALRQVVRDAVPDAQEEVDPQGTMLGFTFMPGTYKGLFAAITSHKDHVNLMFAKGVALLPVDRAGLLEGSGKAARHIAFTNADRVAVPEVRELIAAAAALTPRP